MNVNRVVKNLFGTAQRFHVHGVGRRFVHHQLITCQGLQAVVDVGHGVVFSHHALNFGPALLRLQLQQFDQRPVQPSAGQVKSWPKATFCCHSFMSLKK